MISTSTITGSSRFSFYLSYYVKRVTSVGPTPPHRPQLELKHILEIVVGLTLRFTAVIGHVVDLSFYAFTIFLLCHSVNDEAL